MLASPSQCHWDDACTNTIDAMLASRTQRLTPRATLEHTLALLYMLCCAGGSTALGLHLAYQQDCGMQWYAIMSGFLPASLQQSRACANARPKECNLGAQSDRSKFWHPAGRPLKFFQMLDKHCIGMCQLTVSQVMTSDQAARHMRAPNSGLSRQKGVHGPPNGTWQARCSITICLALRCQLFCLNSIGSISNCVQASSEMMASTNFVSTVPSPSESCEL